MGMGEPLYNYENTAKALRIVMDHEGIALSRRRITLSTSGVVPMMDRCGAELNVNLAVSLHAVTNELRNEIVPLNRKYPIEELMAACRRYPGASNARRITFEYVMLRGVNDSPAEAREFVRLLKGLPAKVNLIPFNPWPGSPYKTSTPEAVRAFAAVMEGGGIPARCGGKSSCSVLVAAALPSLWWLGAVKTAASGARKAAKVERWWDSAGAGAVNPPVLADGDAPSGWVRNADHDRPLCHDWRGIRHGVGGVAPLIGYDGPTGSGIGPWATVREDRVWRSRPIYAGMLVGGGGGGSATLCCSAC